MMKVYNCLLLIFTIFASNLFAAQITGLSCNYGHMPANIDDLHPRLSWQIISSERGFTQSAYRVLVASSIANLTINKGDIWDSRRINSSQSLYIKYGGRALQSTKTYYWKVQVWSNDGKALPWSDISSWTMGLLNAADWKASWITASRWFTPPAMRPKGFQPGSKGGWADIDLGKSSLIEKINLFAQDSVSFPKRFRVLASDEFNFIHSKIIIDQSETDYVVHGKNAISFFIQPIRCRFVRLQIMANHQQQRTTVRQMEVYSGAENVALMKFTREYNTAWDRGHATFLVDGMPSEKEGDTCPADACPADAAPAFRKVFEVNKKIVSATIYYAALGMARVTINGQRVTDEVLGPPFTDYSKRIMYTAYNVSSLMQQGVNVIGAVLGNGFFSTPHLGFGQRHNGNGPPGLLLQTLVRYEDGTEQWLVTDSSWKWKQSEISFNDVWEGYTEDRRLINKSWPLPEFDGSGWATVQKIEPPGGRMVARTGPPNKINGIIHPVKVENNHAWFETASVGWPLLKINGKAGQKIIITGSGPGYTMAKLRFILAEDGPASLSPDFIIQPGPVDMVVEGLTEPLQKDDISIQYINAKLTQTGDFSSSNPWLNELFAVTMRTHRNYINDFPADPNREKQGWTQDAQNMFNTAACLTDVRDLYQRWWNDMEDSQDEQGYPGSVVPVVNRQVYDWNSPWWSGMIVFLPWEHYQYYGNPQILENGYDAIRKYVDFLDRMAKTGDGKNWDDYPYFTHNLDTAAAKEKMIIWNGAGDWNNPYTTSHYAVPTPMATMPAWYLFSTIVSRTAALLGKKGDQQKYAAMAADIKKRFNAKYFHPSTGLYGDSSNSQTGQVLPLIVGMVPEGKSALTYQRLLEAIHARNDHIGTGFIAINYLLQTLAGHRESALANKMVQQQDYPGWKTLIKGGVFQEDWHGNGAQMPSCGGAVGAWLFQSVLGIQPDPQHPGFKQFILSPQPDNTTGLLAAKGYYQSGYGEIKIEWKCSDNRFVADIQIPANSSARLIIPADNASTAIESGRLIKATNPHIKLLSAGNKVACYQLKAGSYHFETNYQLQ